MSAHPYSSNVCLPVFCVFYFLAILTSYCLSPRFVVYPSNNSLSGSETDICSSNENLSQEDRFVICNTLRQEPQGQENIRNSTDSSYNTLIIHGANDEHR